MVSAQAVNDQNRKSFSRLPTEIPIPNLIEMQKGSYERFMQMRQLPAERENTGLQAVFNSIFPIEDFKGTSRLEFVEYSLGVWTCECGKLQGQEHLRGKCKRCRSAIMSDGRRDLGASCPQCGFYNRRVAKVCDICEEIVSLQVEYDERDCEVRGKTYSVPLKVTVRLVIYDEDASSEKRVLRDFKEEEVFFGDVEMITDRGTFIINGTERVIVNQLQRSPGVFFQRSKQRRFLHIAKIIPYRGSWVELMLDKRDRFYVRIDRKKKLLGTVLLRALGLENDESILRRFQTPHTLKIKKGHLFLEVSNSLIGFPLPQTIRDGRKILLREGTVIGSEELKLLKKKKKKDIPIPLELLDEAVTIVPVFSKDAEEPLVEINEPLNTGMLPHLIDNGIKKIEIFFPSYDGTGNILHQTLEKDTVEDQTDAFIEIYRRMRPGDPPTEESSRTLFANMFFNPERYDLSPVGRLKLNTKLGTDVPLGERQLQPDDFYRVVEYLLKLPRNIGEVDDIDHLGNRRVRTVGELLENQFRIGLVRMKRAVKEKMTVHEDINTAMPSALINPKPVVAALREFFGSGQLSQFMDQTNPLAETTHKRRLSALGPGGLSRERAGFKVRDVHPTHYGRICPIETPEGPNIGLITSLSNYARINEFGFIESPYLKVAKGRIVNHVQILRTGDSELKLGDVLPESRVKRVNGTLRKEKKQEVAYEPTPFYLSAWEEDKHIIAQAATELDSKGRIVNEYVMARKAGDFIMASRKEVDFIDVSPKQLISVSAALIPFLEHDDANRALMGSNMQRQAVPLLNPEAPLVGTGMEEVVARDSGAVVVCERDGVVERVDANRIIVNVAGSSAINSASSFDSDIYPLHKFKRSNQDTCIHQKPIVKEGQRVKAGDVLADGPCTQGGELALGRNVLVAFLPWRGYNFEDAILVSERLVREDFYTSVHIEEFDVQARDTKLGAEEITQDIPNVSQDLLKNLDQSGIIRIGATVKPGDILVGKVTPKGETKLTPEEKLLRAIFGEKAGDVKNASLTVPPGVEGTIVDVKIFERKGEEKSTRSIEIEEARIEELERNCEDEIRIIRKERDLRIAKLFGGTTCKKAAKDKKGNIVVKKGEKLTARTIDSLPLTILQEIVLTKKNEVIHEELKEIQRKTREKIKIAKKLLEEKVEHLREGDDLAPGVIKMVKVYIAVKRSLSVGDKIAGRHGNKGVISLILPEEDMPYLPDGTPVEICLNPLGVPSRMNVGQILETQLGWAAKNLSLHVNTPVFDGASEDEIERMLEEARLPANGKAVLCDGRIGEPLDQQVTVGYIYMMKLCHLVDDKVHARSIGPYSLITQQPLGGKAQFGGQRLGEMEVWALEAYGAAHILQELLTAKSDDVYGRTRIYESLVKGDAIVKPGIPESFNVMVREMKSLALGVDILTGSEDGEKVIEL